jgi:hypothetical protein
MSTRENGLYFEWAMFSFKRFKRLDFLVHLRYNFSYAKAIFDNFIMH